MPKQETNQENVDGSQIKTPAEHKDAAAAGDTAVMKRTVFVVYIVLFFLGIGTGFMLSGREFTLSQSSGSSQTSGTKTTGSTDTDTFKDTTSGTVEKGGINGEGTHKLIRDGGPSQTVYLTSSIIDLDEYIGKKVAVWGQTVAAEKAGWLMDVGKIETE